MSGSFRRAAQAPDDYSQRLGQWGMGLGERGNGKHFKQVLPPIKCHYPIILGLQHLMADCNKSGFQACLACIC